MSTIDNEVYPEWKRGNKANISKTPITDGNVLVTTDTEELYIDIDGKRLHLTDVIRLTESQILATTNPEKKLYFATDTGKIYYHDGTEWKSISGSGSGGIVFEIRDDGCLYMICEDEEDIDKFYINDDGCLIYKLQGAEITEVNLGNVVGPPGISGGVAGFGTVTAIVDNNVGTPSVTVATSGPDTAKNFSFTFKNLKGQKGDKGDTPSLDELGGLRFGQDDEGKWGYIAPGADTVTPFKTGDGGDGFTPLIGITPSEVAGTLWFEADSGETLPTEGQQGAYIFSTVEQTDDNSIWCDDGIALTIKTKIPTGDTGEVGCFWIE